MFNKAKISLKSKDFMYTGLALLLFHCLIDHRAQAQDDLRQLQDKWNNGSYSEVLPLLLEYREEPYNRNAEVDYMIATSACRIPNLKEDGYKFFRWILYHYSLDDMSRGLVNDEIRMCASSSSPISIAFVTQRSGGGTAGIRSKTFYWLDMDNVPITSDPVKVVRDIPLEELTSRLFEPYRREAGVEYFQDMAGSEFIIETFGQFILASSGQQNKLQLRKMGKELQKVLDFFVAEYAMSSPPYMIMVYLVPDTWDLRQLAERIHGIRVPESSIGYSFQNDLSMVGAIPGTYTGTLRHELFHLLVRENFGDIPPWMDEGVAALYEVSRIVGDRVVGYKNWRGPVLERFWNLRPSVEQLVKMDWRSFDQGPSDYAAEQQATNHAMARYFILYLQEKQKLAVVYNAFRNRNVRGIETDPSTDAVHLLQYILGQQLSEIDRDFANWFRIVSEE